MRECDIHHTRSIKTNSAVNLSRKPGLDVCCDLLQHLQGVPRTCNFYIIIRTYIDFARPITHNVFHMKCNQIQFSSHLDGIFCSILFHSVQCKVTLGVIPVSLLGFAYDARSRCHSLVWLRRDRDNSFIPFLHEGD